MDLYHDAHLAVCLVFWTSGHLVGLKILALDFLCKRLSLSLFYHTCCGIRHHKALSCYITGNGLDFSLRS